MFRIGIDVGSTYTKYCVMDEGGIIDLYTEKTPLHQDSYFCNKVELLKNRYPESKIVSCGYGKNNVLNNDDNINELTALAKGSFYVLHDDAVVLDIGGQDTKIIVQKKGRLARFFLNDKCAAGSGMFLSNTLERIGIELDSIDLTNAEEPKTKLSTVCAVFAQSEIVEMISNNKNEKDIISAVIWQILITAKALLGKVDCNQLVLSGGLTQINGFSEFAQKALGKECKATQYNTYLSAIGCAV